ncbi:Fic/DOC family protein [Pseudonocardia pini]|uniref:Fic/DOC family protein n=1 Tax=Pseudonocardia pini TaxID=2758030 RepID=UPI0015F0B777|nr:Fic family protein [Pseudonocardia pini]
MSWDPYLDLASGVLRNRLGLADPDALALAEAEFTATRMVALQRSPLPGAYDLPHLQAFHWHIFGDVYSWAGQLRTVRIGKGRAFCPPEELEHRAATLFDGLAAEGHLRGRDRRGTVAGLADLLAGVNDLHPFREGNGRAQRALLGQLAEDRGYRIRWDALDPAENVAASVAAAEGDVTPLRAMLDRLVA